MGFDELARTGCERSSLDSASIQRLDQMAQRRVALIDTAYAGVEERYITAVLSLCKLMKEMSERETARARSGLMQERAAEIADNRASFMTDLAYLRAEWNKRHQQKASEIAR